MHTRHQIFVLEIFLFIFKVAQFFYTTEIIIILLNNFYFCTI